MRVNNAMTTVRTHSSNTKHRFAKLALLSSLLFGLYGQNAIAQTETKLISAENTELPAERWFEIEVILIEQLIDKSRYNEDFEQQATLNNKATNSVSLLNSYLQNIINFEQQLDSCNKIKAVANNNSSDHFNLKTSLSTKQTKNKTTLADVEQELENLSLACKQNDVDIFENAIDKEFYQIPKIISASEDLHANVPYLVNKTNLQLTHIRKSLSRSKHFRPLLHIGWRQAVLDKGAAKPVRLMAGENQFLAEVKSDKMIELNEDLQLSEEQKQEIISNHLQQIITDVEQGNTELETLTSQVKNQQIKPLFDDKNLTTADEEGKQHKQNWHIDGLFNVHLNHYLYINSQFNVITETKNKSNEELIEVLVPFRQNRRVISGEIHYFDHPYMGMIVQIRRHEKPEVIDEDMENEIHDLEKLEVNTDRN